MLPYLVVFKGAPTHFCSGVLLKMVETEALVFFVFVYLFRPIYFLRPSFLSPS